MPTTPSASRRLRLAGAVTAALSAVVLSAGCSLLPGAQAAPAAGESPAASNAPSATAPAPVTTAVGDLVQEADYGTQTTGVVNGHQVDVTLTGIHRISDEVGIVTARIVASKGDGFATDAFREKGMDPIGTNVFAGITLQQAGDPTLYRTLRDEEDHCLCSYIPPINEGAPQSVWAYVTLPKGATTVDVVVSALQPWVGVPVS